MFMKAVGALLATITAAQTDVHEKFSEIISGEREPMVGEVESLWYNFVEQFEVGSPIELDLEAKVHFLEKVRTVIEHNKDDTQSYKKGFNVYSAMTFDQVAEHFHFKENQANAPQECSATGRSSPLTDNLTNDSPPDTWNWQNKGGVSPVKDQGNCGSCWTFSTVGCLESAHLIESGVLATYAEQQLVDCAGAFDNNGCDGGLPSHAFEYIFSAGGIASEESYPYKAVDANCTVESSMFTLSVGHAQNITEADEVELKAAVYKQPVSVAFECVDDFMDYKSGTYHSTNCNSGPSDVNHAVLAVGYGTDTDGMDYWIVKNSWSATWGNKGFFNIERGVNMCGIATCASYPESVKEISQVFLQ